MMFIGLVSHDLLRPHMDTDYTEHKRRAHFCSLSFSLPPPLRDSHECLLPSLFLFLSLHRLGFPPRVVI